MLKSVYWDVAFIISGNKEDMGKGYVFSHKY